MQIKKYVVSDMSEAMGLIRNELGPEAFIVSQREVKQKGLFGAFKRKKLEVTAAKETKVLEIPKKSSHKANTQTYPQKVKRIDNKLDNIKSDNAVPSPSSEVDYEKLISELVQKTMKSQLEDEKTKATVTSEATPMPKGINYQRGLAMNKFLENVQPETVVEAEKPLPMPISPIIKTHKTLEELIFDDLPLNEGNQCPREEKQEENPLEKIPHQNTEKLEREVKEIKNMLKRILNEEETENVVDSNLDVRMHYLLKKYDFSEQFIESFKQFIVTDNLEGNELNSLLLKRFLKSEIEEKIVINSQPLNKVNIFVGPPGVGKTTTIAKIASNEILNHNKKVGLITVDTYRIGAVEQLKTYANILNTPIKIVYTVDDMKHALNELQECDLIIIDSIGRTHKDFESLDELKKLFDGIKDKHTHLVLSLSTKYRQLERIIDNYEMLEYDHLLFTKLDESDCNENIINIYYKTNKPLTYLCMGQEVPDDIMLADKSKLLSLILGGEVHG